MRWMVPPGRRDDVRRTTAGGMRWWTWPSCSATWSSLTGPWPPSEAVLLRVVVVGEAFGSWAWTPGQVDETAAELRARLASDLQDFIAESGFGWAQLRPYREQP